jgi:hypothetical protein
LGELMAQKTNIINSDTCCSVKLEDIVQNSTNQNKISCRSALQIADELGVDTKEVGNKIDSLEVKIFKCGLGLFGYDSDPLFKVKAEFNDELEQVINSNITSGKLTCVNALKIAHELNIEKFQISAFCNFRKIKITKCQLGAFK